MFIIIKLHRVIFDFKIMVNDLVEKIDLDYRVYIK